MDEQMSDFAATIRDALYDAYEEPHISYERMPNGQERLVAVIRTSFQGELVVILDWLPRRRRKSTERDDAG